MPKKFRNKKSSQTSVVIVSFFLLLSLPLVIYGLLQESFDIREKAYDMLELSEKNPCIISFPNVNPYTLEVGQSIRIQVDAKFSNAGITGLEISNTAGESIYTEEFKDSPLQIGTNFIFTPEKSGQIDILGMIKKTDGGSAGCKISSPYDVKGLRAIVSNSSPEFTTNPTQSKPSQDIKTGTQYEYQLSALDTDKDRINYSYSFTPRADWLKPVIIEDGSNGKLIITFRGYTDQPGSYLANVIIHDGYSKHVKSQSWVISVEQSENDIPKVSVNKPEESLRIDKGNSFESAWEVSDLNHISSFELFMAKNVADESSWEKVMNILPYNIFKSTISTEGLNSGTYKLVVKATDNQDPPKSGLGVSPEIVISTISGEEPSSDDIVVLGEPQIINMSPSTEDIVSNPRTTIKGTLVASEDAEIDDSTIVFKVDDKDITDKMKINKISAIEYTLIYQPTEDLVDGTHKGEISFEDTKGKVVKKTWDFTIDTNSEATGTYNIFGIEISKRTVLIIGIGILLIVIAICIPLLIAAIWGKGKREREETAYITRNTPPSAEYTPSHNDPDVRRMVEANIMEPVHDKPITEEPKESEIYSSIPVIETEEKVAEPTPVPTVEVENELVEATPITKELEEVQPTAILEPEPMIEEPKSAFDVKPEELETTIPEPEVQPATILEPEPIIEEPKSAFDVKPKEPETTIPEPIQVVEGVKPIVTTEPEEQIIEPEAPDPSAFIKIAEQIRQQTEDSTTN